MRRDAACRSAISPPAPLPFPPLAHLLIEHVRERIAHPHLRGPHIHEAVPCTGQRRTGADREPGTARRVSGEAEEIAGVITFLGAMPFLPRVLTGQNAWFSGKRDCGWVGCGVGWGRGPGCAPVRGTTHFTAAAYAVSGWGAATGFLPGWEPFFA